MVNKPALDTHELGGEVNTASTGLYNKRRAISRRDREVVAGNAPMHAKETVKLLHFGQQPKEDNMLADDRGPFE